MEQTQVAPQGVAPSTTSNQLDPQAVNLAKAIRQAESGGNFQAQGKSGEYGAYQFIEPTWQKMASSAGVNVPLKQATPEQQNEVAYKQIKAWKDQGYNVGQIASMWNAGEGKPNAYIEGNSGTNKYGAKYDTAKYAKSVATAYQTLKSGGQVEADSNNPSSINSTENANAKPQDQSPSVGGFLGNALGSVGNLIGGIGNAVMHPIDTVKNLGSTALGLGENAINLGARALNGNESEPFHDANTEKADQLANFYNQRYGVSDLLSGNFSSALNKIGHTIYHDPVGAALDASMLLGGAGGAIGKVGKLADAEGAINAGAKISELGSAIDPIKAAGNLASGFFNKAGRVVGEGLGQTTGVGYNPIHEAVTNPSEELTSAMRGHTSGEQILEQAKSGLEDLRASRSATYQRDLENLKAANSGSVDISPLTNGIKERIQKFGIVENPDGTLDFSRSSISQAGQRSVQEAVDMLNSWGTRPGDRTAAGLNTLQMKLGDLIPESGQARAFITPLKSQVTDILDTIPGAKEMRAKYAQSSQFIDDVNRSFMSGNTETAIKKLTSLTRRNNPFKLQLAKELEQATGVNLTGAAAGSEFNQIMPRGLVAPTGGIAELGASFIHPAFLGALPFSSPRLVGELMTALGYSRARALQVLSGLQKIGATSALKIAQRVNAAQSSPTPQATQTQPPQSLLHGFLQTTNR